MGAMDRDANAPAHHKAVEQGHIGLGVAGDALVQAIFVAVEIELFGEAPGHAKLVQKADVAARAKGASACA